MNNTKLYEEIMTVLVNVTVHRKPLIESAKKLESLMGTDAQFSVEIEDVTYPLNEQVFNLLTNLSKDKDKYLEMLRNVSAYMEGVKDDKIGYALKEKEGDK